MSNDYIPFLRKMLQPWFDAVEDLKRAQEGVLKQILSDYVKTEYGKQHHAGDISNFVRRK